MSSCVLAVEPAVSEETEEPYSSHLLGTLFPAMTTRQGTHSARDSWKKYTISEHNQTIEPH